MSSESCHPTLPTSFFFFFNDTATTEIYTLSLHDALPISHLVERVSPARLVLPHLPGQARRRGFHLQPRLRAADRRSEEHTSELQSPCNLVCRLLLEKKKSTDQSGTHSSSSLAGQVRSASQ